MKLKKIASLMLAGIMAVSMLAACGDKAASSTPAEPETPVDNSFAAAVNGELNDKQKAIVTFESDAALDTAVKAIADKFDSVTLKGTTGFVTGNVVNDFHGMMDANGYIGDATKNNATSDKVWASVLIVPGNYTVEGMTKYVAGKVGEYLDNADMPSVKGDGSYKYSYAGDIAYTKVDSLSDEVSAYVIGVVIYQTATAVESNIANT